MKNFLLLMAMLIPSALVHAGSREIAYKLHNRLTSVPPKPAVLDQMAALIESGDAQGAAELAMENPNFYNLTLKNWIKPWSNQDQSVRVQMNDYVATILGVIRDDLPFNSILHDDIIYTVNLSSLAANSRAYAMNNNDHYSGAESQNSDFKATLVRAKQSDVTVAAAAVFNAAQMAAMNNDRQTGLPAEATAGVTTTRNGAANYFSAGTNRRPNRFIFINYLCKDYEDVHDITIPDFRVGRDVERNPGGDSRTFKNRCVGCHAGQDALRGAYAFYDFNNDAILYTPTQVRGKMNQNNYYPQGFVTTNDSWINTWATGQNASLGWRGETSGNGAKSVGMMFSKTRAFSECMAKKVFKLVCIKDAKSPEDLASVELNANSFEANNEYSMKKLIAKTSAGCAK